MNEIHGHLCDECGRTHCSNARECTCHEPGCTGTVKRIDDVVDAGEDEYVAVPRDEFHSVLIAAHGNTNRSLAADRALNALMN